VAGFLWLQGESTMGKTAVITVELVDESRSSSNSAIAEEILQWLQNEALTAPWIKTVTKITVQDA
jgi:hypothetical protein